MEKLLQSQIDWAVFAAATESCLQAFREGLRPPPDMTISEWADQHRVISKKSSGESGPWRTSRAPYLKEVMDELSPSSHVEDVVWMKGSQVGATEVGINFCLYIMDCTPGSVLISEPTVDVAKKYSRTRLQPAINECVSLRGKVEENRSRDSSNTTLMKDFPGGTLIMTGANSAVGFRMLPIRFLFLDEIDGYPTDVDGEGDPVELANRRTTNFSRKKRFYASTPTNASTSRISRLFNSSDQRYYYVPCPFCRKMQIIKWSNITWEHDKPETAHLKCEKCNEKIEEYHKTWMLANGQWVKHNPSSKVAGFHLSALYSPVGWYSWAEAVSDHLKAIGDPLKRKVWVNTVLGEVWEEAEATIDHHWLAKRKEKYECIVPENVLCLTAGVDTQDDRLECSIWGWGANEESWLIEHNVFYGKPSLPSVWELLDEHLNTQLQHASGAMMSIAATIIDAMGHATDDVYNYCRPRAWRRIFAAKGMPGAGRPVLTGVSKHKEKKVYLVLVGVDQAKDSLYARLKIEKSPTEDSYPSGYVHLPDTVDDKYLRGLTAEKKVLRHSGGLPKPQWVLPSGARNEPLDCHNYALAGLRLLNPKLDLLARENRVFSSDFSIQNKRRRRVLSSGITL